MSAKSARKSIELRLDPTLDAALRAYRRHIGARSLAAAARQAVRAALGLFEDGWPAQARAKPPVSRFGALGPGAATRPRRIRLQLEPNLREALNNGACGPLRAAGRARDVSQTAGVERDEAAAVIALLRRHLRPPPPSDA